MSPELYAALGLGFVGSLHCVGMCGPLAVAGCVGERRGPKVLSYLLGRAVSYAFIGALLGRLGGHLAHAVSLQNLQTIAMLTVALMALAKGLVTLRGPRPQLVQLGAHPKAGALSFITGLLPRRGLGLGLVTGLLPCGLLMGGWMLAATTGSPLQGAGVMLGFFVATTPGLLVPVLASSWLSRRGLRLSPKVQAAAWIALAVWTAARPLLMSAHGGH